MHEIELSLTAATSLHAIRPKERMKIVGALEQIGKDPHAGKALQGTMQGLSTLQVWPYRILYTIGKKTLHIIAIAPKHRQSSHKH